MRIANRMKQTSLISPNIPYIGGRICSVASKPLILFIANQFLPLEVAQGFAVAFLLSSLALLAVSADPHRQFYTHRFGTRYPGENQFFDVYAGSIALLTLLGCVVVIFGALHVTSSLSLGLACAAFFTAEQVQDEILRYRLFQRAFAAWGRAVILRTALQLLLLAGLLAPAPRSLPAPIAVLALAAGSLAVFLPQLGTPIWRKLFSQRPRTVVSLTRRSLQMLWDRRWYWFISILGSGIGYLDRLFALFIDKSLLPLFVLVVMCFSVVHLAIDFFYLSHYRLDFLQHRIAVDDAFRSRTFIGALSGGLALATVMCVVSLALSKNGSTFPIQYVVFIALVQTAVTVTTVPREISYWTRPVRQILKIDGSFWLLMLGVVAVSRILNVSFLSFLLLGVGCAVVRFVLHIRLAQRVPSEQVDGNPDTGLSG